MLPETIIHKIFETNSNFHVTAQYGKSLISVFENILLVLTKFSFWPGDWPVRYHAMELRRFPHIS